MSSLNAPIVYAINAGDIQLALDRIAHGNDVNYCDPKFGYPLTWAVQYGQVEVVRALLKHGADPNCKNTNDFLTLGSTPLYLVTDYLNNVYRGELDVDGEIRLLLQAAGGISIPAGD